MNQVITALNLVADFSWWNEKWVFDYGIPQKVIENTNNEYLNNKE
jgi:hypothetical protein